MVLGKYYLAIGIALFAINASANSNSEVFYPEFQAYNRDHQGIKINSSIKPNGMRPTILIPNNIRVKIFPHIGRYSSPQGRETILDEITFQSATGCSTSSSIKTLKPTNALVQTLRFKFADVEKNGVYVICPERTTLLREKNLRSYEYTGTFYVKGRVLNSKKVVEVVQYIEFEDYLKGVVPAEMPASWHMESLKAQAIAARSYALYQLQQAYITPESDDYDLDDTVYYQAYLGLSWKHPNTDSAIDQTRGLAIWFQGRPAETYFSADSGGYTELSENVWKKSCGFCVSKPEAYDLNLGPKPWNFTNTILEIEQQLRAANLLQEKSPLKTIYIRPEAVNVSGRIMQVELHLVNGNKKTVFGPAFQQALRMRSNMFTIRNTTSPNGQNAIEFEGRGFGHGVGMNQWGAHILARDYGWDYLRILNFYYENVSIH